MPRIRGRSLHQIQEGLRQRWLRQQTRFAEQFAFRIRSGRLEACGQARVWRQEAEALRRHFLERPGPHFFFDPQQVDKSIEHLNRHHAAECASLLESADRLHAGDYSQFVPLAGETLTNPPDWHRDLLTGRSWPLVWYRQVDYSSPDRPGEIRHLWDLHRHLFLVRLAQAWRLRRDPRDLELLQVLYHDWWNRNPIGRGIAWIGPQIQEHAVRNAQWIHVFFLLVGDADVPAPFLRDLLVGIARQTETLAWYYKPDKAHSHNHLTAESAGLWMAALLFPELPAAARWKQQAERGLLQALDLQLLEDGQQAECASNYHYYVLEWALHCRLLAAKNGITAFDGLDPRVKKAAGLAARLTLPDGRIPYIGDADDAIAGLFSADPHASRLRIPAVAARFYQDDALRELAGSGGMESVWLLGTRDESHQTPGAKAEVRRYPSTNSIIARAPEQGFHLVLWGGPTCYLPKVGASHRHADWNQLLLWMKGKELLSDPGTCLYNGPDELRCLFRSTGSHSTVQFDGRDQFDVSSRRFGVGEQPPPGRLLSTGDFPLLACSTLEHEGNRHRRHLFATPRLVLLLDELEGNFQQAACQFLSPGDLNPETDPRLLQLLDSGEAHPVPTVDWPEGGLSRRYGTRLPAMKRVTQADGSPGELCLRHLLLPASAELPRQLGSSGGAACWKIGAELLLEPGAVLKAGPLHLENGCERLLLVSGESVIAPGAAGTLRLACPREKVRLQIADEKLQAIAARKGSA